MECTLTRALVLATYEPAQQQQCRYPVQLAIRGKHPHRAERGQADQPSLQVHSIICQCTQQNDWQEPEGEARGYGHRPLKAAERRVQTHRQR